MAFSMMHPPEEAHHFCEGELYVTCDDAEQYAFRDDTFEFRDEELFTKKQANAVWRSKGCRSPPFPPFLSNCDKWRGDAI